MARTGNKEYIERINLELYIMDYLERRKNDGVLRFEREITTKSYRLLRVRSMTSQMITT